MKLLAFIAAILLLFGIGESCHAQQGTIKEMSGDTIVHYLLANIKAVNYSFLELHDRSFFVNVYTLDDPRATPERFFEEYEGVLSSILIAIIPDGDYYTESRLFKIEALENPVIIGIAEKAFPEFTVSLESGAADQRKTVDYSFTGDFKFKP